jgi:hypothetical protein
MTVAVVAYKIRVAAVVLDKAVRTEYGSATVVVSLES